MLTEEQKDKKVAEASLDFVPQSIADFEREARSHLDSSQINYVYSGSEGQATLKRNVDAFSHYLLERRVLQGIDRVDLGASYFDGRITSELPFFPSSINTTSIYPDALLDILKTGNAFSIPIFVSQLALPPTVEIAKLPKLVKNKTSSLIWQIYLQTNNFEECFKHAKFAESWGYRALTITVDMELNVRLGYSIPTQTSPHVFVRVTTKELKKIKELSSLPLIVKGIMNAEDAELAVESGADGIIVSNHGARALDRTPASLEVLPEIVKHLKSKKRTRKTAIFFDGGIRRGSDVLIALALGAQGCLLGRPVFWALACDHENGVAKMMQILKTELERAAILCGVSKIPNVKRSIVRKAEF